MTLLNISHLNAHFAHSQRDFALRNVSLHINECEKVALVGESGSGKSMLAQLILRLSSQVSVQSGSILLNGENLLLLSESQMCQVRGMKIAYIPQEPLSSLNPLHKVGKQILEGYYLHTKQKYSKELQESLLNEALESVGLSKDIANAYPFELSGGQRQRVAIAMSVIHKPSLLICDEPTTALDAYIQKQILELLLSLNTQSAILFISHNLNIVKGFCDRVLVMKEGEIVESAPTQEIFTTPKHNYTKFLLDACVLPHKVESKTESAESTSHPSTDEILNVDSFSVGVRERKFFCSKWKPLVQDVSFSLSHGQIIGIAGASGSGKSSLALGMLGLLEIQGKMRVGKHSLHTPKDFRAIRRDVGIVFQDPFASLSPRLSIMEIIAEGLEIYQDTKTDIAQKVEWALESVGLSKDIANVYPFELSGGQRQRVAIARAIVLQPRVLILDEPTSALDKSSQKMVLNLLLELQKSLKMSYVFITHDLEILYHLSDKILILHHGRVVESGESKKIFQNPQSAYAKMLIESSLDLTLPK
ncbi:ABC transporter ATP-binding protein [Helicobacter sp. MIT 05-5293]|uniref:ATP-binding cassette domain-containing protein n=1 Tax=Helicobacter sp. MIT 05-5293 TaxID=1548149 RepID=UPI0010FD852E|nr:ABC transporter ATP-binding protein [Helicobacter sp. MIT 05-5293]TLD81963.1 ABC transporter ATP-binding protein [Helicobacter sp. MIT 05-5293]